MGCRPEPARNLAEPLARFADPSVQQRREHVLRPGQGHRLEERADLLAEPTRGHEHQPFDPFRELVGELHRHSAAQRVAHHGHPFLAQHGEQVSVCRSRAAPSE